MLRKKIILSSKISNLVQLLVSIFSFFTKIFADLKNLKKSANKSKENKKFNIIIYKQTLYFMKCSLLSFILE